MKRFAEERHDTRLIDGEKDQESHTIDFDCQELFRAYTGEQVGLIDRLVKAGIMSQNESRATISYNPIANGRGQPFFIPNALVPLEDTGRTEPAPNDAPTDSRNDTRDVRKALPLGLRLIAGDVAGRMVRRLSTHAEKAARSDMRKWLAEGINEHRPIIAEAFGPILAACRDFGFEVPTADGVADCLLKRFVANPRAQTLDEVEAFRNHVVAFLSPR